MSHKLITTHSDYWLLVDTEAPIEAMKTPTYNEVVPWGEFRCGISLSKERPMSGDGKVNLFEGIHAIVGHLPKNNAPILEGVPLLPFDEQLKIINWDNDKAEVLNIMKSKLNPAIHQFMNDSMDEKDWHCEIEDREPILPELPKQTEAFDFDAELTKLNTPCRYDNTSKRYNYSESDVRILFDKANTKKWSDEDLNAYYHRRRDFEYLGSELAHKEAVDYISSQSLPVTSLSVGFEPEYERQHPASGRWYKDIDLQVPKAIRLKTTQATFRGKEVEVLEGKWVYE